MIIKIVEGRATFATKTNMELELFMADSIIGLGGITQDELDAGRYPWFSDDVQIYDVDETTLIVGPDYETCVEQYLSSLDQEPLMTDCIGTYQDLLTKLRTLEWELQHAVG